MKKVHNLSELIELAGKDAVDKCFTEYRMLMIARNNKVAELEPDLEDMDDTDMMSVADLKNRLQLGHKDCKSTQSKGR